jgi:hypothetical protein
MDTLIGKIFSDEPSEIADIQANPSVDMIDAPLTPDVVPNFQTNANLFITDPIAAHSYFEIQFHLDQNFWGTSMNFGNDPSHAFCVANNSSLSCAGLNIRQGIAHLIDRGTFASRDPNIVGGAAIDSPIQKSNGGLPSVNPCNWDILTHGNQVGANCALAGPGGTAWHVAAVTHAGPGGAIFLADTHDPDFCIAADHFVLAGLATGHGTQAAGCTLTGINSAVTSHVVNFFVRNDNPPRLDLGNGLAQTICALFGQGYVTGCTTAPNTFLSVTPGPITAFPGFQTSPTTVKQDWWMYTAAYIFTFPFDIGFYFTYSSHFVSGIPSIIAPIGPCASDANPSNSAADYMYICNPAYDAKASLMEFAPCLSNGASPTCANGQPTGIAAGEQVEDFFGNQTFTIPVFSQTNPSGARSIVQDLVNNEGSGLAAGSGFQFLNAWSNTPTNAGAITQGFKSSTTSINPYLTSTVLDSYIDGSVYDTLGAVNPLKNSDYFDWMSVSSSQLANSQLTYAPPGGTVSSFRFTLRSDIYFQDGSPVTAFDVAYSYLSLRASGSFNGATAGPMTGITVLAKNQIDINVNGFGPFTKLSLTSLYIMPGHYWSNAGGSAWDSARATCTGASGSACYPVQYTLGSKTFPTGCGPNPGQTPCIPIVVGALAGAGSFPASNMNPDPNKILAIYDPLAAGTLIGSGGFECNNAALTTLGTGCAPNNRQNPAIGQSYVLQRFGKGLAPNSPAFQVYFRSYGNIALYLWTLDTGAFTPDFVNFTTMAACFNLPVTTSAPCAHFQRGIGSTNGNGVASTVQINQVLEVNRFVGVNFVFSFDWRSTTAAPIGIVPLNPTLHEGANGLLTPCSPTNPNGYDC